MKNILIIGAGAMGAAFSIPLLDNGHSVVLTEPYNFNLIKKLNSKRRFHPSLNINLPKKLKINKFSSEILNHKWDLIVIAVSSIGIDVIGNNLSNIKKKLPVLVLTKGLKLDGKNLISMSGILKKYNKNLNISVLKGPCLAKELARKVKSFTVVANKNINTAKKIGKLISTNYYQTEFSRDVNGVEFLSAIKNIYSMIIGAGQSLNASSNLFQKSIIEMKYLTKYLKGKEETTLSLAGVGDLYVSAAGGRNSKMGSYLGKGYTFKTAKKRFMPNDTVEGEQLAREIAPFIIKKVDKKKVPLMINLLRTIT
mgnify:CR=1 FL=1